MKWIAIKVLSGIGLLCFVVADYFYIRFLVGFIKTLLLPFSNGVDSAVSVGLFLVYFLPLLLVLAVGFLCGILTLFCFNILFRT